MKLNLTLGNVGKFAGSVLAVLALLGICAAFTERNVARPYVDRRADTVFVLRHAPCVEVDKARMEKTERKVQTSKELIVRMYYRQKATMTPEEERRAMDDMASDSMFKKLLEGD